MNNRNSSDLEIKEYIESLIEGALNGDDLESDKIDFKSKWYDLKKRNELMEFLKDSSAIANTPRGDGFIIMGINVKNQELISADFSHSGLPDESQLQDVISKWIIQPFSIRIIEGKYQESSYSILHIPSSNHKPHLIKQYETYHKDGKIKQVTHNELFIRRGTTCRRPYKHELDELYRHKHEIANEIDVIFNISKDTLYVARMVNEYELQCTVTMENIGYRPVCVNSIELFISFKEEHLSGEYRFRSSYFRTIENLQVFISKIPILINPNRMESKMLSFNYIKDEFDNPQELVSFIKSDKCNVKGIVTIANSPEPINLKVNIV